LAAGAPDVRVVGCEVCGTEGCAQAALYDGMCHCRYNGRSPKECIDACPWCEGTGGEVIAVEPIEMGDLVAEPAHHATAATVGADRESKGGRLLMDISAGDRSPADQLSDAVLANVLNWDDALGLAYRLSSYYAVYPEIVQLADIIWRRAQERHQLDRDERS
jgi:hypothetical protein